MLLEAKLTPIVKIPYVMHM